MRMHHEGKKTSGANAIVSAVPQNQDSIYLIIYFLRLGWVLQARGEKP